MALHNGSQDCNKDERTNTADNPSTCDKNLFNFGPVILVFVAALVPGGLHAGICTIILVILGAYCVKVQQSEIKNEKYEKSTIYYNHGMPAPEDCHPSQYQSTDSAAAWNRTHDN